MAKKRIEKKIILFIVEGITDEYSLSLVLSRLINSNIIQFHVVNTDITSDMNSNQQNIVKKVNTELTKFLRNTNGIKKEDIEKIVHLVDIDGAYVEESKIIEEETRQKAYYTSEHIITSKRDLMIERNKRKSSILNKLAQTYEINKVDYSVYYFSCNLEHVLHNEQNVPDNKKIDYANDFEDKFDGKEEEFIKFLSESEFTVQGEYKETWSFIKLGTNSLNRNCNFHLFFNK